MSNISKIGITGMNAASKRLESISNNLANSATSGFKAESQSFSSVYIRSGQGSQGVGVKANDKSYDMSAGAISNTGGRTDMAIAGEGFYIIQDEAGRNFYTRDGGFEFNKDGYLVTKEGFNVMGYPENSNVLKPIQMGANAKPPEISENVVMNVNLGGGADMDTITTSLRVTDSLGERHDLYATFENRVYDAVSGEATWDLSFELNGETFPVQQVTFDSNGALIGNANGMVDGEFPLDLTTMPAGSKPLSVDQLQVSMLGSTGFSGEVFFRDSEIDGNTRGEMIDYEFTEEGALVNIYSNGERATSSRLALSSFDNVNGLRPVSGNKFEATDKSGDAEVGRPGQGGLGEINVGFIESSNVDTAEQLVNMIDAQQMYQGNSKSVTTARELSQVLMNM